MFLFGRIRLTKCLYSGNKDAMTFILGALFFLLTFPCAVQVVYCLRFSSVKTDSFVCIPFVTLYISSSL
jgi:hypothetical protein